MNRPASWLLTGLFGRCFRGLDFLRNNDFGRRSFFHWNYLVFENQFAFVWSTTTLLSLKCEYFDILQVRDERLDAAETNRRKSVHYALYEFFSIQVSRLQVLRDITYVRPRLISFTSGVNNVSTTVGSTTSWPSTGGAKTCSSLPSTIVAGIGFFNCRNDNFLSLLTFLARHD